MKAVFLAVLSVNLLVIGPQIWAAEKEDRCAAAMQSGPVAGKLSSMISASREKMARLLLVLPLNGRSSFQPKIDLPARPLNYSHDDRYVFRNPIRVTSTYNEGKPGEEGSRPWSALPYVTSAERAANGRELIAARVCEFFNYATPQPRITELNGQAILLSKALASWGYDTQATSPPNSPHFRQIRLLSALLGQPLHAIFLKSNPAEVAINSFENTLGLKTVHSPSEPEHDVEVPFDEDGGIAAIMSSVDVTSYPVNHPWRQLNLADATEFVKALQGFSDATIAAIVGGAEIQDANINRKLIDGLKVRRDAMKSGLISFVGSIDPRPNQIIAGLTHVQALIKDMSYELFGLNSDVAKQTEYIARWSEQDIGAAEEYLKEFSDGKILDVQLADKIWEFLKLFNKIHPGKIDQSQFTSVLRRSIELGKAGDNLTHSILYHFISAKAVPFIQRQYLDIVKQEYYSSNSGKLGASLREMWYPGNERDPHIGLFPIFARLALAQGPSYEDLAEIFLLSVFDSTLVEARTADFFLSQGLGFHNAQDVNKFVIAAGRAIDDFNSLGVARVLTARLDLAKLQQILFAMSYDSLGRRRIGQSISVHEAFGIDGATRSERFDPYTLLSDYIAGRTQVLNIQVLPKR